MNNLYALYSSGGPGLPKNEHKALEWLTRAAKEKNARALANLSAHYSQGSGVQEDPFLVFDAANQSMRLGDLKGKDLMASYFLSGTGTNKDFAQAISLYTSLAQEKPDGAEEWVFVRDAQYTLGQLHAEGVGVPKDYKVAYRWFLLASTSQFDISAAAKEQATKMEALLSKEDIISVQKNLREDGITRIPDSELYDLATKSIIEQDFQLAETLYSGIKNSSDPRYSWIAGKIQLNKSEGRSNKEAEGLLWKSCKGGYWYGCFDYVKEQDSPEHKDYVTRNLLRLVKTVPDIERARADLAEVLLKQGLISSALLQVQNIYKLNPSSEAGHRLEQEIQDESRRILEAEAAKKEERRKQLIKSFPELK
jgi:TPR repeat protein